MEKKEEKAMLQLELRGWETEKHTLIQLTGGSRMPFWRHDLKFSAIIGLLATINRENYQDNEEELERACQEVLGLIDRLRND